VLGGPATASVSGHQLQTSVKQALQQASATVLEIRPRSMSESRWLNESQLDVSFSIPAVKLESLFKALERQRPLLHIKLMSLREATHSTAGALQLEARLTVSARSVSDSLSRFFSGSTASNENILEVDDSASTLPELAGLFNAAHREKLRNPSAEHYRLSAVSLSANARIAIIADLQSGATRRMQEGELLDGWKITAIKSDSVYLQSGKLTANLRLQKK
ncbi:MAG: type II secretion system protein M, partial [Arenicella sp.]|nr:type II secretion system protein M [Arenicella sp.]